MRGACTREQQTCEPPSLFDHPSNEVSEHQASVAPVNGSCCNHPSKEGSQHQASVAPVNGSCCNHPSKEGSSHRCVAAVDRSSCCNHPSNQGSLHLTHVPAARNKIQARRVQKIPYSPIFFF